ncbi:MAG: YraN family protein [Beijerinckiaceae bacterium]|nr:YraN family protein [Beijerinckiaceae bacterium]
MRRPGQNPNRPTTESRRRAQRFGGWAEWAATLFLIAKGYRILERNYREGGGEIDLIVQRGRTVAFVEVKARPSAGAALLAIDDRKLAQIAKAARHWLSAAREPHALTLRFDAVLVAPGRLPRHMQNIAELPSFG